MTAKDADLAHLVERDLAKVEVAGSNPVIRSIRFDAIIKYGSVVQLVRTLACHARGRGFESHPNRQNRCLCRFLLMLYNRQSTSLVRMSQSYKQYQRGSGNPEKPRKIKVFQKTRFIPCQTISSDFIPVWVNFWVKIWGVEIIVLL